MQAGRRTGFQRCVSRFVAFSRQPVLFPLTLSLSLGERGSLLSISGNSKGFRAGSNCRLFRTSRSRRKALRAHTIQRQRQILPLPEGEGWGEGEGSAEFSTVSQSLRSACLHQHNSKSNVVVATLGLETQPKGGATRPTFVRPAPASPHP